MKDHLIHRECVVGLSAYFHWHLSRRLLLVFESLRFMISFDPYAWFCVCSFSADDCRAQGSLDSMRLRVAESVLSFYIAFLDDLSMALLTAIWWGCMFTWASQNFLNTVIVSLSSPMLVFASHSNSSSTHVSKCPLDLVCQGAGACRPLYFLTYQSASAASLKVWHAVIMRKFLLCMWTITK